jgi:glycosyltransferase involved in cell wall biosynthesis
VIKPKVLLFIDWYLPGYKAGGPVTSISNMVAHLRKEIDFYIITRDTDYCEDLPYSSVNSNQWVHLEEGVSVFYFSKDFLTISNLKQIARKANCDQWYINGVYSFYFSILPLIIGFNWRKTQLIVSTRGMISPHSLSVKPFKKKLLLRFFRLLGFYKKTKFHATNQTEAVEIKKQMGVLKEIHIAPNLSKVLKNSKPPVRDKDKGSLKLVSLARISSEKNTLGALEILMHVKSPVQLDWYGKEYDQEYFRKCQETILLLPEHIEVNLKGSISPSAIPSVLENYHFLFLPTLGENFGHSILESLISACPVIISDQTPWRNLEEKGIGWDISLADKSKFIEAIEKAASMDQADYSRMSEAAFDFAKSFIENPAVLEANRKLFNLS